MARPTHRAQVGRRTCRCGHHGVICVPAVASAGAYFLRGEIVTSIAAPVALPFMFILMVVACQMLPQGFGINPLDQMQQ